MVLKKHWNPEVIALIRRIKDSLFVQYHVSLESEMDDTALAIHYGLAWRYRRFYRA